MDNYENLGLQQIGKLFDDKFKIDKYEARKHILRDFNGWGDGFGINSKALCKLRIMEKPIFVFFHKINQNTEVYITSAKNWLELGHVFETERYEEQIFLSSYTSVSKGCISSKSSLIFPSHKISNCSWL